MAATPFDLARLLDPVAPADFFRDSWEAQPLHVARGAPDFYRGFLTTADVEQVIAFTRPKFTDVGAFAEKSPRARSYVQGWLADRQIEEEARYARLDEVRRVYARGVTVVLMTMQQRWGPIAALCRALEDEFRCPVHANLYLTPPGAQGFDAHFDPHEVFVLQLEGSKQWRLYGSPRPLPLVDERFALPRDTLGTAREVTLEAGDLLYVPRGVVHEAFTSGLASMHLTVGVNVYRWADLLGEALMALTREDTRFRESLPRGLLGASGVTGAIRERFAELLRELANRADVSAAARSLGDHFFEQLTPLPGDGFAPTADAEDIGPETVLYRTPGLVCRVVEQGGWVTLEYPGGQVGGPRKIAAALRFVAERDRFAVAALPDDLGADAKLVLARRLVRERLLRVEGPGPD